MKHKILLLTILISTSVFGQKNEHKYIDDVQSIDTIITAYYDVVSGSSDEPWEFERDQYIHSKNAFITRIDEEGVAETHSLEAEYIPLGLNPKEDFLKKNLKEW